MAVSCGAAVVLAVCAVWLHGCDFTTQTGTTPKQCSLQRIANGTVLSALEGEPGQVICDAGFKSDPLAIGLRCVDLNGNCTNQGDKGCKRVYGFEEAVQLVPAKSSSKFGGISGVQVQMGTLMPGMMGPQSRRLGSPQNGTLNGTLNATPVEFGVCLPKPGGPDCPAQRISHGLLAAADQGKGVPLKVSCDDGFLLQQSALSAVTCTTQGFQAVVTSTASSAAGPSSGPWKQDNRRLDLATGPSSGPSTLADSAALCTGCCQAAPQQKFNKEDLQDAFVAPKRGMTVEHRPSAAAPLIAATGLFALMATAAVSLQGVRREIRRHAESTPADHSDSEAATHLLAVEAEDCSVPSSDEDEDTCEEECTWE